MMKPEPGAVKGQAIAANGKNNTTGIIILLLMLIVAFALFITFSNTITTRLAKQNTKSVFQKYGDYGLKKVSEEELTIAPHKTIKKGNKSIAVEEVYYDESRVSVGLIAKSKDMIAKEFEYQLYCNGKLLPLNTGWGKAVKVVKGSQYDVMSVNSFNGLPERFNLKIVAKKYGEPHESLSVAIPISRARTDAGTREVSIAKSFSSGRRNALIKSILFTPSSTVVMYKCEGTQNESSSGPRLYDSLGKKVEVIGGGGVLWFQKGDQVTDFVSYSLYSPVEPISGNYKLNFIFANQLGKKATLATQIEIPAQ